MRLIDAEYAEGQLKLYCNGCENWNGIKCRTCYIYDALCIIDDSPTVKVPFAKSCHNCKYNNLKLCRYDIFCADCDKKKECDEMLAECNNCRNKDKWEWDERDI